MPSSRMTLCKKSGTQAFSVTESSGPIVTEKSRKEKELQPSTGAEPPVAFEPRVISWLRTPRIRSTLTLSALWLFIGAILVRFRAVLLPFGLAMLLAFIIEPVVDGIARRHVLGKRIPRVAALMGIYLLGFLLALSLGSWSVQQVGRELRGLGSVSTTLVEDTRVMSVKLLDKTEAFAQEHHLPIARQEIEKFLQDHLVSAIEKLTRDASSLLTLGQNLLKGAFQVIFGSFLVLMLAGFMSIDRDRIQQFFRSLVPPTYQGGYGTIVSGTSVGLAGVVRGQVIICLMNGALTFVGLYILGVKLPLLLASVAAIFSLIPIFGSILSTVPIVAMALTDSFTLALLALAWVIGIHLLEANMLNPKIMGDSAKIHPVLVVFSLIAGERTAGLMGALFAVPIASVLLTVFKFLHRRALDADPASKAVGPSPTLDPTVEKSGVGLDRKTAV